MFKYAILTVLLSTAISISPGKHGYNWLTAREFKCLADNVYYEARGEPFAGQMAVARVTLNRLIHPKYPSSICGVVYQPKQFSWTLTRQRPPVGVAYEVAKEAAMRGVSYNTDALFYHSIKMKKPPTWAKTKTFINREGNHLFYV